MRFLLAIVTCSLVVDMVCGCGICHSIQGNPLALPHPRAIEIAVATRSALDKGALGEVAERPESAGVANGWNRRPKLTGASLLRTWLDTRDSARLVGPETFSLHVVLIDTEETFAVHVRGGSAVLEHRAAGTADAVVATTRPALQAILTGRLGLDQSIESGLLVVEGNQRIAEVLWSVARR